MIGNVNQPSTAQIMDVDGTLKTGAVDVEAVLADNVVTAAKIADNVVGAGYSAGSDLTLEAASDRIGAAASASGSIATSIDTDGTLKANAVDVAAVLASGVVETAKIKDANVTGAKLAATAVQPINLVFDPFNKYTTPGTNWGTLVRWRSVSGATASIVDPDAANPYRSRTLRCATGAAGWYGKAIQMSDAGLKVGDVVKVAALMNGTAAETGKVGVSWLTAANAITGSTVGGDTVTFDGTTPQISYATSIAAPADASMLFVHVSHVAGSGDIDVYAFWATLGNFIASFPAPDGAQSYVVQEIIDARGSLATLDTRLDVALNENGTLKSAAIVITDGSVTGAKLATAAVAPVNIVFDPFNQWTTPGTNWSGLNHWRAVSGATASIVDPDANNPYGAPTMRCATGAAGWYGKVIRMKDVGLKVGDVVKVSGLINGAAGTAVVGVAWLTAANAITGSTVGGNALTLNGTAQVSSATSIAAPADAAGLYIYTARTGGDTGDIDVYSLWATTADQISDTPPPTSNYSHFWQELIDGRTTTEFATGLDSYGRHLLHSWQAQIARIQDSVATNAIIGVIGDSWVNMSYITRNLAAALQTLYGDAGAGWIDALDGLGTAAAHTLQGITFIRAGTWTNVPLTANSRGVNANHQVSTDTVTPASITVSFTGTSVAIHYWGQADGGSFRYQVDALGWVTIDTSATSGYQVVTIGSLAASSHSIALEVTVAGANGVILMGFEVRETGPGVRLHRLGTGGAAAVHYAALDETCWTDGLTALDLDTAVIILGTNDYEGSDVAEMQTSLETMITRIRAALPLCDIVLVMPGDTGGTMGTNTLAEFATMIRTLAVTENCACVDLLINIPDNAEALTRGVYVDSRHPGTAGGRLIANILQNRLLVVA